MRRGAKPTKPTVEPTAPVARKSLKNKASSGRQFERSRLSRELEERNRELAEAHEQQKATSEILRVISSSPTDVQPVFDAIVRSAVRLCDARFANVFRLEGKVVHLVAHHNIPLEALEQFRRTFPQPLSQGGTITAQAMLRRAVVHIHDIELLSDVPVAVRELTRSAGYRSVLAVPILRDGGALGAIGVGRSGGTGAPRPFSDKEVELLTTFADQAAIAIENVRLFKETKEALEQQTATAEILRVIASSPTDLQPVIPPLPRMPRGYVKPRMLTSTVSKAMSLGTVKK
jgi:two-component system, NtrC family, sensor kinase